MCICKTAAWNGGNPYILNIVHYVFSPVHFPAVVCKIRKSNRVNQFIKAFVHLIPDHFLNANPDSVFIFRILIVNYGQISLKHPQYSAYPDFRRFFRQDITALRTLYAFYKPCIP